MKTQQTASSQKPEPGKLGWSLLVALVAAALVAAALLATGRLSV
jgi:hypothetical protein